LVSATIDAGTFSNNVATDSGSLRADATTFLSLSTIDFVNSTVTEGASACADLL
jgi:hypothetical protein